MFTTLYCISLGIFSTYGSRLNV